MEVNTEKVLNLKKLNAAYVAAQEFDYCPDGKKSKKVSRLFNVGITENELKDALDNNQGRRPDEIAQEISNQIIEL